MKLVLTVWLALALVAPRGAWAEPDTKPETKDAKPSAAADARGKAHFQRGQQLSTDGDYAGAYREFAAGYAATGRPLFLFNMGEAARASGDTAKARDGYQAFLRADPKSALAATAKARLADLDRGTPDRSTDRSTDRSGSTKPDRTAPAPAAPSSPTSPAGSVAPPGAQSVTTTQPPYELRPPSATAAQPVSPIVTHPDGSLSQPSQPTQPPGPPIWKRGSFWLVVGGVVIASGAIAFAATRDRGGICTADCTQLNFR